MKKATKIIIRIIGGLLIVSAIIADYYTDTIFNDLDFYMIFAVIIGVYLLIASPEHLESWKNF